MTLTRPRAVLLDWDNTLVDSFPAIHRAMNAALEAMGRDPWSFDVFCARIAHSMRDIFPKMFGDSWTEAVAVFNASYAARDLDHIQPLPGAEALLETFCEGGFYLGLVSNKSGHYLREEVSHLGWQGYFGRVVGATDAAEDKPSPIAIEFALEGSGIVPGRDVWFVGDNAVDVCRLMRLDDRLGEDRGHGRGHATRHRQDRAYVVRQREFHGLATDRVLARDLRRDPLIVDGDPVHGLDGEDRHEPFQREALRAVNGALDRARFSSGNRLR